MKILSIEIGVDVTHVLEMDYRVKNPKVYRSFSFQTPVGVIGEAGVRKSEEFRTALHKLLDANKIKTRKTLFVVNSGKIASREVLIPYQGFLKYKFGRFLPGRFIPVPAGIPE